MYRLKTDQKCLRVTLENCYEVNEKRVKVENQLMSWM